MKEWWDFCFWMSNSFVLKQGSLNECTMLDPSTLFSRMLVALGGFSEILTYISLGDKMNLELGGCLWIDSFLL